MLPASAFDTIIYCAISISVISGYISQAVGVTPPLSFCPPHNEFGLLKQVTHMFLGTLLLKLLTMLNRFTEFYELQDYETHRLNVGMTQSFCCYDTVLVQEKNCTKFSSSILWITSLQSMLACFS